jgi:prevent-host-death family protein
LIAEGPVHEHSHRDRGVVDAVKRALVVGPHIPEAGPDLTQRILDAALGVAELGADRTPRGRAALRGTELGAIFGTMDIGKDIKSITELKKDASRLVAKAKQRRSPIVITQNGKATAVLQDVESFENQRRALLLLKLIAQGEQAYRDGRSQTHDQAAARLERRLAAHKPTE